MRRVILESPYAGDIEANVDYARRCVRDSLLRGEAPIASHLLYTQPGVLRDEHPEERMHGINAGLAWRAVAEATVVYVDRGISKGMQYGIETATAAGLPIEYRSLGEVDYMTAAATIPGLPEPPNETAIMQDIMVAYSRRGALVWRQNVGVGRTAARVVRFGMPGMADLGAIYRGVGLQVEVKRPGGRQRKNQRHWQAAVERSGGIYVLAFSVADAVAALDAIDAGRGSAK